MEKFAKIFDVLDGDNDDVISLKTIQIEKLDDQVSEQILPLVEGLNKGVKSIKKSEFVDDGVKKFMRLTTSERNLIMSY